MSDILKQKTNSAVTQFAYSNCIPLRQCYGNVCEWVISLTLAKLSCLQYAAFYYEKYQPIKSYYILRKHNIIDNYIANLPQCN